MKKAFFFVSLCVTAVFALVSCDGADLYKINAPVFVTGLDLDRTNYVALLGNGKTLTLNPIISPANATNKHVSWESANDNIATVSGGTVTFLEQGETTITAIAYDGEYEATCTIVVTENRQAYIEFQISDLVENAPGEGTMNAPKVIKPTDDFSLGADDSEAGTITSQSSGWVRLLTNISNINNSLSSQEKIYFDLDLSDCTMPTTAFELSNTSTNGKQWVRSLILPNSTTTITGTANTFTNLTSITLPATVTSISFNAFSGCQSLITVTCLAPTPPTLGQSAFPSKPNFSIYVPAGSVDAYKGATSWIIYANYIKAIP